MKTASLLALLPTLLVTAVLVPAAAAQNSSLYRAGQSDRMVALTLEDTSLMFQAAEPSRVLRINDLVTVLVDAKAQVTSDANVQRRKQAQLEAALKDWVELNGLSLQAAPQSQGDPKVNGTLSGQFRAEAKLQTAESMKFRIAARVVDIRPNGHLVLEAHQTLRNNDEQWDISLSGIARPEDVLPNNTVLSEHLAELHVYKREQGHVRDGYRRGWLYMLIDKYGLF